MSGWCLANHIGPFNARILEELGYRTRDDILNAKVFDLMLIGSFSSYDIEDLLITFAAEKYPTMADRLFYGDDEEVDDEESLSESKDDVKIYGLTRNDRPNQKVKSITVNDVLHFRPLTQNKIEVLLEILENGMMRNEKGFGPSPYFETVDLLSAIQYHPGQR
jgi:hypothetical protein